MRLSPFDIAIIVLYVVGITLFGMRFRGGQHSIKDYFLGGRNAPWWAISFSIVATETSLLTVIGTPAIAFAGNLGFLQLVMGYICGRIVICFLFIPQYFKGEFYTAYQLIEKRFGERMKTIAAGTFLTLASHGTDQLMVQRLLAARSERESKLAIVSSGAIVFLQFSLFLVLGVMLYAYNQHAPLVTGGDNDRVFPEFVVREMPHGLSGLVIAAIFAAAMSNLSGALNSLASSTIVDFARLRREAADPAKLLRLSRWITVGWGIVLMLLGVIKWGGVLEKGLTIASIIYQSLLGLFLLGILNRRATANGALTGMFVGLALMLYLWAETSLAFTWYVLVGATVTFAVGSLVSLFDSTAQPNAGSNSLT